MTIGSRGSRLALVQARTVMERLKELAPDLDPTLKVVKTRGDREANRSLDEMGGQGIFVKELEQALLSHEVDLAVHSLKDVPSELAPGLELLAVLSRDDPRDVFVSAEGIALADMPPGSRIGTGSHRRAAQLKAFRTDMEVQAIRGNVDTRLRKVRSGDVDGVILAAAALWRMGWQDRIMEYLSPKVFIPAVGQGALVVEGRAGDSDLAGVSASINDTATWWAVTAERAFLRTLGGGCRAPIAALGTIDDGLLHLEGMVASVDYSRMVRDVVSGPAERAQALGVALAERVMAMGGDRLVCESREAYGRTR